MADDWGSFIKIFYIIPVLHLKWWSKYTYYTALFQKKMVQKLFRTPIYVDTV